MSNNIETMRLEIIQGECRECKEKTEDRALCNQKQPGMKEASFFAQVQRCPTEV